ncbi:MAG TPA: hypothetical protein VFZ65_02210 [Planctomycetota bacterium]|nr:hypothetical protein [Planctomycetota bacterium]
MTGKTSKVFDTWFSDFRSAAKAWSELIPSGSTVSSTGGPTYYAGCSDTGWVKEGSPDSPLATAAAKLAKTCREFAHEPGDLLPIALAGLESALDDLAAKLDADPDPATFEQTEAAREIDDLVLQNFAFKRRIATEGITEVELRRLERKSRQMEKGGDLRETYSLWQQTIDLIMRTNLHESARVDELCHLRGLVSRLVTMAHERAMPRVALQRLGATLGMLMPREWFQDAETRRQVRDDIRSGNVEVEELYHAWQRRPATPLGPEPETVPDSTTKAFHRATMAPDAERSSSGAMADTDTPQPCPSQEEPPRLDDDVERAFHLLRHYKDFVCAPEWSLKDDTTERAIGQLEDVLRHWLPPALKSNNTFLKRAHDVVGDRAAARVLLAKTDLFKEGLACLDGVARATIPPNAGAEEIVATCRAVAERWCSLQPRVHQRPNGERFVMASDRTAARAPGMYWSIGIKRCPSRVGASLALAVACRALAAAARERDAACNIAPAVRLDLRLREAPDWARLDDSTVVQIVDEQLTLLRDVQELLGVFEISVETDRASRREGGPSPEAARARGAAAEDLADDRQLVGWREILPVLGYEASDRRARELVKKLNQTTGGPIRRHGQRGVIVNRGVLIGWWRTADRRAHDAAEQRAKDNRQAREVDAHLSNPGVRRDEGFHDRGSPNKRKRDS